MSLSQELNLGYQRGGVHMMSVIHVSILLLSHWVYEELHKKKS